MHTLDLDHPFTTAQAAAAGITRERLRRRVRAGELRQMLRGVYLATTTPDRLDIRVEALRLVVPPGAVVVDETAAWLHGVDVLEPGSHLTPPPVQVFHQAPGCRLRTGLTESGERRLAVTDVETIHGLRVTTPLRTAADLGRLRQRERALAAIDGLLRLERFVVGDVLGELDRFKGYRGIVQLRALAPLADPGAESPAESALRLAWYDAGLPRPVSQFVVAGPAGTTYRLDLALPGLRLAVEYDGAAHHSSPDARAHDAARRRWITEVLGWTVVVITREQLYGGHRCADRLIREAFNAIRAHH